MLTSGAERDGNGSIRYVWSALQRVQRIHPCPVTDTPLPRASRFSSLGDPCFSRLEEIATPPNRPQVKRSHHRGDHQSRASSIKKKNGACCQRSGPTDHNMSQTCQRFGWDTKKHSINPYAKNNENKQTHAVIIQCVRRRYTYGTLPETDATARKKTKQKQKDKTT